MGFPAMVSLFRSRGDGNNSRAEARWQWEAQSWQKQDLVERFTAAVEVRRVLPTALPDFDCIHDQLRKQIHDGAPRSQGLFSRFVRREQQRNDDCVRDRSRRRRTSWLGPAVEEAPQPQRFHESRTQTNMKDRTTVLMVPIEDDTHSVRAQLATRFEDDERGAGCD